MSYRYKTSHFIHYHVASGVTGAVQSIEGTGRLGGVARGPRGEMQGESHVSHGCHEGLEGSSGGVEREAA